jgi:hypothetical protein
MNQVLYRQAVNDGTLGPQVIEALLARHSSPLTNVLAADSDVVTESFRHRVKQLLFVVGTKDNHFVSVCLFTP